MMRSSKNTASQSCDQGTCTVMHIITSLDYGGVERHMETIAKGSINRSSKYRHMYVALSGGGATAERIKETGARVVCLETKPTIPSFRAIYGLINIIRDHSPDVVHTHGVEANFHGMIAAAISRVTVRVAEEIGIPRQKTLARLVIRSIYKLSHQVVAVSNLVANWLERDMQLDDAKIVVLYNPVIMSSARELDENRDGVLRIVFVGRMEDVKNPMGLLLGYKKFFAKNPVSELWYVGKGSQLNELQKKASELRLSDRVVFWGYIDKPEEIVRQADIFIQPSHTEGMGIALIEAMSTGIPVVTNSVGVAPELISHGVDGWIYDGSEPGSIYKALESFVNIPEADRADIGRRGKELVLGRYSVEQYLNDLEEMYDRGIFSVK